MDNACNPQPLDEECDYGDLESYIDKEIEKCFTQFEKYGVS